MGQSDIEGQEQNTNANKPEAQCDEASPAPTPIIDPKPIKPTSEEGRGFLDCYGEKKPEVSNQATKVSDNGENGRSTVPPNSRLPEWISAFSSVAAVFVAVAAVYVAESGTSVNENQLEEMRKQRELTMLQLRANFRKNGISIVPALSSAKEQIGWAINPVIENAGGTDARDVRYGWVLFTVPGRYSQKDGCPSTEIGPFQSPFVVTPPGQEIIQSAHILPIGDATASIRGERTIFMKGRIEYRDIFPDTESRYYHWCIRVVPNDIERNAFSFFNVQEEKN
jgi:hypothetical protein